MPVTETKLKSRLRQLNLREGFCLYLFVFVQCFDAVRKVDWPVRTHSRYHPALLFRATHPGITAEKKAILTITENSDNS